jgi:hypothetical protein
VKIFYCVGNGIGPVTTAPVLLRSLQFSQQLSTNIISKTFNDSDFLSSLEN